MAPPQGLVTFAGIRSLPFMAANVVLTHGVGPNLSTIQIPPQPGRLIEGGSLELTYGGQRITLHDCKVDSVDMEKTSGGLEVWTLNILDRRWKWRMGEISGFYNVRRGNSIVPHTIRSARQLAALCLDAMGETRYSVAGVPAGQYPEVEWDYENPAQALGKLCDAIGCRVILKLNNTVAVVKAGEGARLPRGGNALRDAATVDPPERPDSLRFVGERILWQWDLILEAVAEEPDGRIVPLNSVSYAPPRRLWAGANKWALVDLTYMESVAPAFRELAKRNVFRKYRVRAGFTVPGFGRAVTAARLDDILPLESRQLEKELVTGEERRKDAAVWGVFALQDSGSNNNSSGRAFTADLIRNPEAIYQRGFRLDTETGIVEFNEPIYRAVENRTRIGTLTDDVAPTTMTNYYYAPADLRLRTAFGIRDPGTSQWNHATIERRSPAMRFGTKPEYVKRSDVPLHIIYNPRRGIWVNNAAEYQQAGNSYLDEHERRYELDVPQGMTYPGLERIDLDGAVQQVRWQINENGTATDASRNREEPLLAPNYAERRLYQRTTEELLRIREASRAVESKLASRK